MSTNEAPTGEILARLQEAAIDARFDRIEQRLLLLEVFALQSVPDEATEQ